MASWWRDALNAKGLSQGDVLHPLYLALPVRPEVRLRKLTCKKGVTHWEQTDVVDKENFLSKGAAIHTIVLSHSCDLDKPWEARVIVGPVFPINTLPAEHRAGVMEQRTKSMIALPQLPELGDCYADLRSMSPIPRELATEEMRLLSMSPVGLVRLQVQLMEFFLRVSMESIEKTLHDEAVRG